MTDRTDTPRRLRAPGRASSPGKAGRGRPQSVSPGEMVALALSLAWLGLVGWFFLTADPGRSAFTRSDPFGFTVTILGVFMPVALIWVAASTARTARSLREESARLQAAIDAMRHSYVEQQMAGITALRKMVEERIAEVSRMQAVLGAEVAALNARGAPEPVLAAQPRPVMPDRQPALALETAPEAEPLPPDDFIRALNFPDNERDTEGFRVLRAALEHHPTAQLVTAAQDLLTLLAQDGIYMDDLTVHRADAVLWRAFAEGTHGSDVAALGGIRDRSSLALTGGRMKDDPVFRDAVHHFLRTFDRVFTGFAENATDAEIMRFSDTRTARAFMLTARVAGTFN